MMRRNLFRLSSLIFFCCNTLQSYPQVVVINEVCTSPAQGPSGSTVNANSLYNVSATEQPPENREWIELYNTHPCNSADISCYTLASNMLQSAEAGGTPNWGAFTFPAGTVIPPLGFVIIGGNNAQVPLLDFNMNYYRQNAFGTQYLDGDYTRWFLRDEYGWIALYDPSGNPVDAVYWDAYGDAANLYSQTEYAHSVVTTTSCSGTQTLTSAITIAGIEYIGMCNPGTNVSFQRVTDGSAAWFNSSITSTPRQCNGPCVVPPVLLANVTNESCAGNDGSITLTIQDGHSGPYTINWLQPAGLHNDTIENLNAGTYIVQVVDAYGCFIVYDMVSIIKEPDPTIVLPVNPETCSMSNGTVQTVVNNANPPVHYTWNFQGIGNNPSAQNLAAGIYSVTITDGLGCTASNSVEVVNFPGPVISIDSVHNEMCSASDGAISTDVIGGTPPLTYSWNSSISNAGQLTGIHAGLYSVTVTDLNGCTASAGTIVTDNPPPDANIANLQADTCHKQTGSAYLNVTGGHPPYNFQWSIDSADNSSFVTQLSEGTYYVSVTDSFCTRVVLVIIPLIPGPQADFGFYPPISSIDKPDIRFEDLSTGIIHQWLWDFGDYCSSNNQDPYHTYNSIGNFTVTLTITNNFGCFDSISKTVMILDRMTLFIPNCFTPNGDGVNDCFFPSGQRITDYEIFIYDRWGELVFHSTDFEEKWNGTYKGNIVPEDVYTWIINYSEDWAGIYSLHKSAKGTVAVIK